MANAMLDARQEGDSYRRVEVITGERRRRRWTGKAYNHRGLLRAWHGASDASITDFETCDVS